MRKRLEPDERFLYDDSMLKSVFICLLALFLFSAGMRPAVCLDDLLPHASEDAAAHGKDGDASHDQSAGHSDCCKSCNHQVFTQGIQVEPFGILEASLLASTAPIFVLNAPSAPIDHPPALVTAA